LLFLAKMNQFARIFCLSRSRGKQDRLGRDATDADTTSAETMSTLSESLHEPQDAPSRKNRKQLTSTEYALQEIRCAAVTHHPQHYYLLLPL